MRLSRLARARRSCTNALAPRRFAAPVSDLARDAQVQAACPFVTLRASGGLALVVRVYSTAGRPTRAPVTPADRRADSPVGRGRRPVGRLRSPRWKGNPQATCDAPPEPGDVLVRLAASAPQSPPFALGFSYVPGIVATALVDRIHETALRTNVPAPMLLGAVIAHGSLTC